MSYPYTDLESAGVDIAALVNEEFLNKFSKGHHKVNPELYEGVEYTDELGDKVEIKYNVSTPLKFDLTPISEDRFRPLYESHLIKKGMSPKLRTRLYSIPANIKLVGESVLFEIAVIDKDSGEDIIRVPFNWDMESRCAVNIIEDGETYSVRLDPLKVEFSASQNATLTEIKKAIFGSQNGRLDEPRKYKVNDPEWCIKLERLILILVNKVIAVQLSNFIRSWELPKTVELASGVSFKPSYLNVASNYLALGGQVTMTSLAQSDIQAKASAVLSEYASRVQEELDSLSDEEIENIQKYELKSVEWLKRTTESMEAPLATKPSSGRNSLSKSDYDKNVALLFNSKPIDLIAKKELSVQDGSSSSARIDRLLKGEAGWSLRVHSAEGGVSNNKFWIKATPEVGGYARLCYFDVDPKNFGKWKCRGIGVKIAVKDARLEAYPSFENSGVYVRGRFSSSGIEVTFDNWPDWANKLLSWVTRTLSDPILDFLGTLLRLFRVRIISYPKHFPGTGLEWSPNVNTSPSGVGPYIEFSADPEFEKS